MYTTSTSRYKIIIQERPDQRPSFGKHRLRGHMVNIANDHFQSWMISVKKEQPECPDTIELLPTKFTMPKTSSNDRIVAAFEEILTILNNPKLRESFLMVI